MATPVDATICHSELELDTPSLVSLPDPTQQLEGLGPATAITERVRLSGPQCQVGHYLRRGVVVELTDGSGYLQSSQVFVITQVMHGVIPLNANSPSA
ncbi:hypothetical protein GPJ83_24295 [Aeromonas hydrophila]|nr:hypothetical protein [Aeromonas hydrophila]